LARLGGGLEAVGRGYKAPLGGLPEEVRERLEAEGLSGTLSIDFDDPPAPRCRRVQRTHPLISVLAETLLERTLGLGDDSGGDPGVLGRVGCWVSPQVTSRTTIALLRIRHQLTSQRAGKTTALLVEEASAIAWSGQDAARTDGADVLALLAAPPAGDPPLHVRDRAVTQGLDLLRSRAEALLADHRRVREASSARGSSSVVALVPPDVIGLFVLLPSVS
jgi:hypothetical protein